MLMTTTTSGYCVDISVTLSVRVTEFDFTAE